MLRPLLLPHLLRPVRMRLLLLLWSLLVLEVRGHGRLIEPPSRSTMWRYGFDTPANYNDHELYCGGYSRQWSTNGGKCGICGDPWDSPQPRENEAGGRYGNGIITRRYRKNQVFKIKIELTANHMGHFEFRLCPNNNPKRVASQACLDKYVLHKVDGGTDYFPGPGNKVLEMVYRLPKDLTCSQCVLQWRYIAANNWGTCANGTGGVGCGPQEEFRACSDIAVTEADGSADSSPNLVDDVSEVYHEVETEWEKEKEQVADAFSGQNIAIIVLATLLTTFILFAGIFFYYYRAKAYLSSFMDAKGLEFPSLPPLPRVPGITKLTGVNVRNFCKLDKLGNLQWPLSNISFSDKLPTFKQKSSEVKNISGAVLLTSAGAPIPPPRAKRDMSRSSSPGQQQVQPRLATIQPRAHPRPPAPPPVRPPPVLEISAPTEVTINGVTFRKPSPMSQTAAAGPTPSSSGIICAARPAIIMTDIPDSSLELSMPPSVPSMRSPPLPSCPPPDSFTDICINSSEA